MDDRQQWRFVVHVEPRGKAYMVLPPRGHRCKVCGQTKGFAQLGLSKTCETFEVEVCRIASQVLPVFGTDTMLGIRVDSIKKRPRTRIGEGDSRLPCPVKPDASNVLKCVEDSLMRCRQCGLRKSQCGKRHGAGHRFQPTLPDDSAIVDNGCRTFYSAVDRRGPKKKDWIAKPSRIEVLVWVVA